MIREEKEAITIRAAAGEELARVKPMWVALYEHQQENGMLLNLPDDAYQKWVASINPLLGRFACLFLAESSGEAVGFLAARIRSIPPYFGGGQTGFISEVYVDGRHRSKRIGERLMAASTEWFREIGISRIELQVIAGNSGAREFYARHGWREELVQMVWQEEPGES